MTEEMQPPNNGEKIEKQNQDDDESDWEYEYHDTELEVSALQAHLTTCQKEFPVLNSPQTFNIIVDFSSSSNVRRKPKANEPAPHSTQLRNPSPPADEPIPLHEPTDASVSDRIQILDLHTSNPLISYQSQLYTCNWTTTIGTDMILSPTTQEPSPLLFTTRHKLIARPARLTPHTAAQSSPLPPNPPDVSMTPHDAIDQPVQSTTIIPLDTHASLARQRQAAFLERLMAAKVARGETDEVTVYSQKRLTGTGWRSQQKAAAAEEAEAAEAIEEAEEDSMEEGLSAEGGNGERTSRQARNRPLKRPRIGRPRGKVGVGKHKEPLFGPRETPTPNPGNNSTNKQNKDEKIQEPVGQAADQHAAAASLLPAQEPITIDTNNGEADVVMQDA
jgi:hypothetical protein